ncbi:hypothetical protein N7478_007480 [Penicillium angulare]|uniref:uncharacterized protein n=1 Tax=Penicillium angulare TaxID=116970 RepID=UPI002540499D|nr:uncharacterized protein N7478_007480 [Penicillium angulare]KAJ5272355.1 hypothetical protein N7478_007480 [Penicillium angulare]
MEVSLAQFFDQRAKIVSALDEYGANVCEHGFRYYSDIATSLQSEIYDIASLVLTLSHTATLKSAHCAQERLSRIISCLGSLRETLVLFRDSDPGEVMELLYMVSRQVGRIRLLGVIDPYADGMDQHIKELNGTYGARGLSGQSRQRQWWARNNWRVLNFGDSHCDCSHCRGHRENRKLEV